MSASRPVVCEGVRAMSGMARGKPAGGVASRRTGTSPEGAGSGCRAGSAPPPSGGWDGAVELGLGDGEGLSPSDGGESEGRGVGSWAPEGKLESATAAAPRAAQQTSVHLRKAKVPP